MIAALAAGLTTYILASYWVSTRPSWHRPHAFDRANVVAFAPLAGINVYVGAWWAAAMNVAFGLIAIAALRRRPR